MISRGAKLVRLTMNCTLYGLALVGAVGTATAQTPPHSSVASPEIYKVIAENDQYRIIAVTWKPGQRDQFHSHPASGVYYLTDCALRNYAADGKFREGFPKAGAAVLQPPIPSHSIENIGKSDCNLIMFEPR
jgi:hypothetical protein